MLVIMTDNVGAYVGAGDVGGGAGDHHRHADDDHLPDHHAGARDPKPDGSDNGDFGLSRALIRNEFYPAFSVGVL